MKYAAVEHKARIQGTYIPQMIPQKMDFYIRKINMHIFLRVRQF